ncbi:MAG: PKD domain-containing protein, partial [Bacteroidales bacterium]|nr:PKD domain-containing protein [Bacteroidales bacterium]
AVFSVTPENADTSTVLTFNAGGSSDMEDRASILSYRWDFEGKLNWTEPVNDTLANFKYSKPGTYNVGLKVIDTQGWSDETRIDVIVEDSI